MSEQRHSLQSARAAARRDELNDWVADFLGSPGSDNGPLAAVLTDPPRWWLGPIRVPLHHLNRLAGPEGHPVLEAVDDDFWGDGVVDLAEKIDAGWEPPPVIVSYRGGQLVLEDGNHRVESLRRAGEKEGWAVVAFDEREERDRFYERVASVARSQRTHE